MHRMHDRFTMPPQLAERHSMTQLGLELPVHIFLALRMSPKTFVRQMRVAAPVQWYAGQCISQEKAAEMSEFDVFCI